MSFQQALSGLAAASTSLGAIGNNIANSSTIGFKGANAQFADSFAVAMMGGGTSAVGIGALVNGVAQQFTQGNLSTTNNPMDIAVNGGGLFRMDNNGTITYTRNGQFILDKDGFIVNNQNLRLTGFAADLVTGTIVPGNIVPLRVDNSAIAPSATTKSEIGVNLDSRSTKPITMLNGWLEGAESIGAYTTITAPTMVPGPSAGNNQFLIKVDGLPAGAGNWVTVKLNPKVNPVDPSDISYSRTEFVAEMQRAIDAALIKAGISNTGVDVSLNGANQLVLTSRSAGTVGSAGNGSTVQVAGVQVPSPPGPAATDSLAITDFFGDPTASATDPDYIKTSPQAIGYSLGAVVHPDPAGGAPTVTVAAGANRFLVGVDGQDPIEVIVPAQVYSSALALAQQIEESINSQMAIDNRQGTVSVTLTDDFRLRVVSEQTTIGSKGRVSAVVLDDAATDNGMAALFGNPMPAPPAVPAAGDVLAEVGADLDNFDLTNANSYTASTAQTVYDSLGNAHTLSLYYVKTSEPKVWQMYTTLNGDPTSLTGPIALAFDEFGRLEVPAPGLNISQTFELNTGAQGLLFGIDLSKTTQHGINFGTNQLTQDGYTSGKLAGLSVSDNGIIQGRYSNGRARNMGQLVLVSFNNLNGLQSLGNNQWAETMDSGSPLPGAPGTGNLGLVQSGAVEESNVDMSKELVHMITAQRAYQANAQTIKTQDQILQTLVNLR